MAIDEGAVFLHVGCARQDPVRERRGWIVVGVGKNEQADLVPEFANFVLADETFGRALRRYTGENLEVTDEDQLGTLALIQQLMTDIDYALLIDMTANAIVEEYDGPPPDGVFGEFERLVRRTISETDLMDGRFDGPMN